MIYARMFKVARLVWPLLYSSYGKILWATITRYSTLNFFFGQYCGSQSALYNIEGLRNNLWYLFGISSTPCLFFRNKQDHIEMSTIGHAIHMPTIFYQILCNFHLNGSWNGVLKLVTYVNRCDDAIECPLEIAMWPQILYKVMPFTRLSCIWCRHFAYYNLVAKNNVESTYTCNGLKSLMLHGIW